MTPLKALQRHIRRVIFLEKAPETGVLTLTQRRVFTLPSKPGLAFLVVLIICFLTSTNYNLNLGFGMTYLLGGIAIINTFYTFRNLAYLQLKASHGAPVFAGDNAEFTFYVSNPDAVTRYALHFSFRNQGLNEQIIDLDAKQETSFKLSVLSQHRGSLACPRVQIETRFPLGLLRAWSTWLPDSQTIIYPHPELNPPPLPNAGGAEQHGTHAIGQEEFSGVRNYQQGDPLKQLSWKHIARIDLDAGGSLISKQFSGNTQGAVAIDFAELPAQLDLESKLSRMTAWVLEAERQEIPYSFRLGSTRLKQALGEEHRNLCLKALALYGFEDTTNHSTGELLR